MNIEALRNKLKTLEEGKPKSKKWKPKDEHTVRLLPLPGDEDLAFIIKWHYGVDNGRQMYCPTTHGDECPFCELGTWLKSWNDDKGHKKTEEVRKRDWEAFKKIDAAVKHYVPMVERKKDSLDVDGPFLWELTPKTYTSLFKICANDDWNEEHPDGGALKVLTSLTHGLDLVVTLKKAGQKGNTTSYDLTEVEERKKFSPLFKNDVKAAQALLLRIPTADDIGKPITTAEAQKVFDAWEGSMNSAPADTKSAGVEYETHGSEKAMTGGKSVNDTVAELEALLNKK